MSSQSEDDADPGSISISFYLTVNDYMKVSKWLKDIVYPEVIAKQKESFIEPDTLILDSWERGYPYSGACGGGLTYTFTPTGLGMVTIVRYGEEYQLDITDYENW